MILFRIHLEYFVVGKKNAEPIPTPRREPRGVNVLKKENIIKSLVPLMPENRKQF